jgi:flagellar basal body-associated protein FliL
MADLHQSTIQRSRWLSESHTGSVRWPLLLVIALAAVSLGWVFRATGKKSVGMVSGDVESVVHLEPFVLNLQDPNQKAYLRIGIDIGVDRVAATHEGSSSEVPLLRDTIIQVLSRCGPDDLLTDEGKGKVKTDLVLALQKRAPSLGVQEVYFTDFLVQR